MSEQKGIGVKENILSFRGLLITLLNDAIIFGVIAVVCVVRIFIYKLPPLPGMS